MWNKIKSFFTKKDTSNNEDVKFSIIAKNIDGEQTSFYVTCQKGYEIKFSEILFAINAGILSKAMLNAVCLDLTPEQQKTILVESAKIAQEFILNSMTNIENENENEESPYILPSESYQSDGLSQNDNKIM